MDNLNPTSIKHGGGIISSIKVENENNTDFLQKIVHSIEKNERELTMQRSDFERYQNQMQKDLQTMQHQISTLEQKYITDNKRIETLEKAIQIPGTQMSVGESVLANRKTLVRTLNLVSKKADSEELNDVALKQEKKLNSQIEDLKIELASNVDIQKLNQANHAIIDRIDVLADDLRNKVDKSFLKVLSSESASLRNFADFERKTNTMLKTLEESIGKTSQSLRDQDSRTKSISDQMSKVSLDVDQIMQDLEALSLSTCDQVKKEELSDLHRQNTAFDDRIRSCQNDTETLFASHETLAKHLTKRISDIYTKHEVEKRISNYLDKDTFFDEVQKIHEKVGDSKSMQALQQLQQSFEKFKGEMNATVKKADLSAQFIALYEQK
jgi:chromosome segregation ATPase